MTPWRFSREARAELRDILRGVDVPKTITQLEAAVTRYQRMRQATEDGLAQDRRLRTWAATLCHRLDATHAHLKTLTTRHADMLTWDEFSADVRADLDRTLSDATRMAKAIQRSLLTKPGPRSRMDLNGHVAQALQMAGLPLRKGRASRTHRVFVVVYDALDLSREGDVFRAVKQGVDLVTRGYHVRPVRHSPRRR